MVQLPHFYHFYIVAHHNLAQIFCGIHSNAIDHRCSTENRNCARCFSIFCSTTCWFIFEYDTCFYQLPPPHSGTSQSCPNNFQHTLKHFPCCLTMGACAHLFFIFSPMTCWFILDLRCHGSLLHNVCSDISQSCPNISLPLLKISKSSQVK